MSSLSSWFQKYERENKAKHGPRARCRVSLWANLSVWVTLVLPAGYTSLPARTLLPRGCSTLPQSATKTITRVRQAERSDTRSQGAGIARVVHSTQQAPEVRNYSGSLATPTPAPGSH